MNRANDIIGHSRLLQQNLPTSEVTEVIRSLVGGREQR